MPQITSSFKNKNQNSAFTQLLLWMLSYFLLLSKIGLSEECTQHISPPINYPFVQCSKVSSLTPVEIANCTGHQGPPSCQIQWTLHMSVLLLGAFHILDLHTEILSFHAPPRPPLPPASPGTWLPWVLPPFTISVPHKCQSFFPSSSQNSQGVIPPDKSISLA